MITYKTIDEYIQQFPVEIQEKLQTIRKTIHETVPEAKEVISYGMPAFKLTKDLVYFGAFKKHVGFFPTPEPIEQFSEIKNQYETTKGSIHFPYDKPLPLELIRQITLFRRDKVLN